MAEALRYFLALLSTPSTATQKIHAWLAQTGDLPALFKENATSLAALGFSERERQALVSPAWAAVDKALRWAELPSHHLITWLDARYPPLLREISDPPWALFVVGSVEVLTKPAVAIVGSRAASLRGMQHAEEFAQAFAASQLSVVSGLARGIDAAAHRGALTAQGLTLAVMGTGVDTIYPAAHKALAQQIAGQGALVTEFLNDVRPRPEHFPRRNRIIAGLSLGVLVVEAHLKSGSLITARLAAEQNREVFAIPGPIYHPGSRGCHALLRQGAKLVETPHDVLEEFGLQAMPTKLVPAKSMLASAEAALLVCIDYEITPLDVILLRSGLTAAAVSSMLLALELSGYVLAVPGGYHRINHSN